MAAKRYEVMVNGLNVRKEPSIHGKIIETLELGDVVRYGTMSGDDYWYRVTTPDGTEGWVAHKYLRALVSPKHVEPGDPKWLPIAIAELGTKEFPGAGDNPRIAEYLSSTTLDAPARNNDETPWCSAFVNWCVEKSGFAGTDSAWAKSWLAWGKPTKTPSRGAITVFTRNAGGHVAFFLEEAPGGIRVLGGNQHDEVNTSIYRIHSPNPVVT